ncbi:MAG: putative transport system permease protein [Acidobacteriota bacterium]|nr:putative transport system permease protein [Acidobacteriota bacterium]
MKIGETVQVAFGSLRTNKLRSALTVLGIVIGIFSIISISTVISMMQNSIEQGLSELGKYTFQIQKFPAMQMGRMSDKIWHRKKITIDEYYRLRDLLTEAKYVGAEQWRFGCRVKSQWEATNPNIQAAGVTPEALLTNQLTVESGRAVTQNDLDYNHRVCILGTDLVKKLFKSVDPIDQEIQVNNLRLKVIGVFEARGQIFGQSRDNFLVMPLTVFQNEYGKYARSINITVMAYGPQSYNATIDAATGLFRTIRKVPPGEENDFEIYSNDSLIMQMNAITKYVKWGSIMVALIALLAAGVGIMNIMLVSVTERTREIGIRKALGAKKRNILVQFLIEAIALSQFGGVIGIILGLMAGNMAGSLLKAPPAFPLDWIITGIALCVLVGIGFGTYPAYKAASLDPIEALRYE